MQDKLIRAIVPEEGIQITAAISTNLVERSRQIHHMTPVATAALGRTLTIASIMGSHLKIENGSVTIQIKGNGSLGTICCVAAPDGFVRGYLQNPTACGDMPLRPDGKLNVGQGVGRGYLMVIKDIGLKDPMTGTVALVNGEIAEDITYYFAESEQIPSACGLGVLIDTDYTVKAAGGFLVQLLPHATDKGITQLEQNITQLPPVTTMLAQGLSLKEMIQKILASFSVQFLSSQEIGYRCTCSRGRVERALLSMGRDELESMIREQETSEVTCQFCDKVYMFSRRELQQLLPPIKK